MQFLQRAILSTVVFLFAFSVAFGSDPKLIELTPMPKADPLPQPAPLPDTLSIGCHRWFTLKDYTGPVTLRTDGTAGKAFVAKGGWLIGVPEGQKLTGEYEVPAGAVVLYGIAAGPFSFEAWGVVDGRAVLIESRKYNGDAPRPPPGPAPKPKPDVDPSPAPIPGEGLRVLIVYESMTTLPSAQAAAIYGQELRDYAAAKCAKGADGKTPELRIYDKDTPMDNESATWKAAMLRPRTSVPWLIVSNGKTGFEGPLPATLAETMKILKQFGGE